MHPLAGKPAPVDGLVDLPRLISDYYSLQPDPGEPAHRVQFGTSGHRGSGHGFCEAHIRAIAQAVVDVRRQEGITGPMYLAKDTHALSEPAWRTALEVLIANDVAVQSAAPEAVVPTPLVSRAVLTHNAGPDAAADALIITPSHNPPTDGGIKYNPPHGGPSESRLSAAIETRANELLATPPAGIPFERAWKAAREFDFVAPYLEALPRVLDLDRVRDAGVRLGADPLGGTAVAVWGRLSERYGLDLEVTNPAIDGTFRFMPLDHDGKIRMDCSSPYAMANLVRLKDRFDVAFGNDADGDRHGIVTPGRGLFNPNHYLAVAVDVLLETRDQWSAEIGIAQTVVTSDLVRRVAEARGRHAVETPVGFKWFVPYLAAGKVGLAGEESAGASILTFDGRPWTTDKDGIVLALLAAEIRARTGRDLVERYRTLTAALGEPVYRRMDAAATPPQKAALKKMRPEDVRADTLAGHPIRARMVAAPGNDAPIGGLKVVTDAGWFAARPSGTENVTKIYGESFEGEDHLQRILDEAQLLVQEVFRKAGV
jgi:phosphoglucomutase